MLRNRVPACALALVSLMACETTSQSTLMPNDVPLLYEPPLLVDISSDPCAGLREEIDRLSAGLGELPFETAIATRSTVMQSLERRAKDALMGELKGQMGGVLSIVRFVTDQGETDRLRAEGKTRGLIRRAYVMGYLDASTCAGVDDPDIEVRLLMADLPEPDATHELAGSSDLIPFPAQPENVMPDVAGEQIVSFGMVIEYVVDEDTSEYAELLLNDDGYPIPDPSDLGEDGLWPPRDALGYAGVSTP